MAGRMALDHEIEVRVLGGELFTDTIAVMGHSVKVEVLGSIPSP